MSETVLLLGAVCVIAAIVGGGLKVAKIAEIPLIDSVTRQTLLAVAGAGLIGTSFALPEPDPPKPKPEVASSGAVGEASMTLSKASGPPGSSLRVGGSGFAPDERLRIRFHAQELSVVQTDAQGEFAGQTIVIPTNWPADGRFDVVTTGERSGRSATAGFEVPAAEIEVSPASGKRGSPVRVSGSGFAVAEPIEVVLHLERLSKVNADGEGRFSTVVTVPTSWPFGGQFDIKATGQGSRRTAREPFTIG
jgi:hypothetical protein